MATLLLHLYPGPRGGPREIAVELLSDEDTVPFEHERRHKDLVERVLHGGTARAAARGRVAVERAEDLTPVFLAGG